MAWADFTRPRQKMALPNFLKMEIIPILTEEAGGFLLFLNLLILFNISINNKTISLQFPLPKGEAAGTLVE